MSFILKLISEHISHSSAHTMNLSGIFSGDLKIVSLTPVYKQGDANKFGNYNFVKLWTAFM